MCTSSGLRTKFWTVRYALFEVKCTLMKIWFFWVGGRNRAPLGPICPLNIKKRLHKWPSLTGWRCVHPVVCGRSSERQDTPYLKLNVLWWKFGFFWGEGGTGPYMPSQYHKCSSLTGWRCVHPICTLMKICLEWRGGGGGDGPYMPSQYRKCPSLTGWRCVRPVACRRSSGRPGRPWRPARRRGRSWRRSRPSCTRWRRSPVEREKVINRFVD